MNRFDEGRRSGLDTPPPSQTGQADLPHPAFQFVAPDGFGPAWRSRRRDDSGQPRRLAPRSSRSRGTVHCRVVIRRQARCSGASGRTALRHYPDPCEMALVSLPTPRSYPPSLHDRYSLQRYYGGSDPDRSRYRRRPWFPDSRHQNVPPFCLQPSTALDQTRSTPSALTALFRSGFAVRSQARQNRRPNRVHVARPYGRTLLRTGGLLPVALHPGISPRCSYFQLLALQCRPGQGLAPCCSSTLSGARAQPSRLLPSASRRRFSTLRIVHQTVTRFSPSWVSGGTPATARETRALPILNCRGMA